MLRRAVRFFAPLTRTARQSEVGGQAGTRLALGTRAYSTTNQPNHIELYAFRLIAAALLFGAGLKVVPFAAAALVGHTIKLMDTSEPVLQSAGIFRLYWFSYFEAAKKRALESGAVPSLLTVLLGTSQAEAAEFATVHRQDELHKALHVLDALSQVDDTDHRFSMLFQEEMRMGHCGKVLRKLIFELEEVQFSSLQQRPDEPGLFDNPEVRNLSAQNFQLARSLYKDCLRATSFEGKVKNI
jgi:hypothetical protein